MSMYSIARRTTGTTSGQASMDVATSTGVRPKIMEWGVTLGAATASIYALNKTTALGTRTTPVALESEEDPDDVALTGIVLVDTALAWSAQPTFSTNDIRRIGLPATIGTGVIWTFPRGWKIDASLSGALVNRTTNGVVDSFVAVDV